MKLIPLLFSTPMVQAILDNRKTMTRRLIKPQPIDNIEVDGNFFEGNHKGYVKVDGHPNWREQFVHEFSKYKVGDVLWVRETFNGDHKGYPVYKADVTENLSEFISKGIKWKPSLFMPFAACRLFLKITNIRIEQLHDITNEDAIAEGILKNDNGSFKNYKFIGDSIIGDNAAKNSFFSLWMSINGSNSYLANPWVWVISFERCEKPTI